MYKLDVYMFTCLLNRSETVGLEICITDAFVLKLPSMQSPNAECSAGLASIIYWIQC